MTSLEIIDQIRKNLRDFISINPVEWKEFEDTYGTCIECDIPECIRIENHKLQWNIIIEEDEFIKPLVSINLQSNTNPYKPLTWWRFEKVDKFWTSTTDNIANDPPQFPDSIRILMEKLFGLKYISRCVYGISYFKDFKNKIETATK